MKKEKEKWEILYSSRYRKYKKNLSGVQRAARKNENMIGLTVSS